MKVKYSNLKIWFKEKVSQPRWYVDLFSYRRLWGAFSIYSHCRRSDGKPNIAYSTPNKAQKAVRSMERKYGVPFMAYKCLYCDGWHVARSRSKKGVSLNAFDSALYPTPVPAAVQSSTAELDHTAIMATGVADLAPVYGGYRGRTLSSPRQAEAWPVLVNAGIRQVIDLRADYTADVYGQLCSRYGVKYYHYPVAEDEDSIRSMVVEFDEFCQLLDAGQFYISCAMGLHRTDIALSLYWVFHAADKGAPPPVLKGYVGSTSKRIGKLIRMVNTMQERLSDMGNRKGLPADVFMQRKKILENILLKYSEE
jgi:hypothetical protein